MGQEFASSSPFMFFTDHTSEELIKNVSEGRKKFLEQFPSHSSAYQGVEGQRFIPNTFAETSFQKSKVNLSEREKNKEIYQLHYDLINIRKNDPVISAQDRFNIDGAVLDQYSFVLRYFGKEGDDRLLLINLERDLEYYPLAEPLLAPSNKGFWELIWSSDNPSYGGPGIINPCQEKGWKLPSHSAILLKSGAEEDRARIDKHTKPTNSNTK